MWLSVWSIECCVREGGSRCGSVRGGSYTRPLTLLFRHSHLPSDTFPSFLTLLPVGDSAGGTHSHSHTPLTPFPPTHSHTMTPSHSLTCWRECRWHHTRPVAAAPPYAAQHTVHLAAHCQLAAAVHGGGCHNNDLSISILLTHSTQQKNSRGEGMGTMYTGTRRVSGMVC